MSDTPLVNKQDWPLITKENVGSLRETTKAESRSYNGKGYVKHDYGMGEYLDE